MSKTNELIMMLEDLTEVGRRLVACGEDLIRVASREREYFSESDAEEARPGEPAEMEPAPVPDPPAPKTYTKEEVRAMLADLSQAGFRAEAKALVKKYSGGGSLTDIHPADYPDLVEEAKQVHA